VIQSQYAPEVYAGNGSLTAFAFTWRILAKTDVIAITQVVATGVVTIKTLNTDYTIADGDVNTDDGGDVVFGTAPPTGTNVYIFRDTARTQLVNIEEGSPFPAATVTKVFDRLTIIVQELIKKLGTATGGRLLKWDTRGQNLEIANSATFASETTDVSALLAASEGIVYFKGGKYVVAYNDAGTKKYRYLDLTSTNATWTYTTSAP
jgi:hypothetical protein